MIDQFALSKAFVKIEADSTGLRASLQTKLKAAAAGLAANVGVKLDDAQAKAQATELRALLSDTGRRYVALLQLDGGPAMTAQLAQIGAQLQRLDRRVTVKIGTVGAAGVVAQIAGINAALGSLEDKIKTTAAGGGLLTAIFGRGLAGAFTKVNLFSAVLPGILGSVSALHLLVDGVVEAAAVLIPATIALIAFGAAGADTGAEIVAQMQNVNTVVLATGKALYPMTGQFGRIADAVRPEVYQLFGDVLSVVNARTGAFIDLAKAAGSVLDQLGARATVAITGGLGKFLQNAAPDLAKLGDAFANVFGTIGNLLKAMPGIAQVLLSAIDNTTKGIEAFSSSGVVQGIGKVALGLHGAWIYAGLLGTASAFLVSKGLGLISGVAGKAALGLEGMGRFGGIAATAMDSLAGGAGVAAALPWGWIALAAAVFGVLAFKILTAKDATQQWLDSLQKTLQAAPALQGFTMLQLDQTAVAGRLASAQVALAGSTDKNTQASEHFARQGASVNASLLGQQHSIGELTAGQKQLSAQSALYTQRLDTMGAAFGGVGVAQGLLVASGVTMNEMLKKGTNAWLIILQQVSATQAAYRAMGQTSGMLGADMNALNLAASDQVVQMGKLNTAWDTVINIVQGGQLTFLTFETNMKGVATAAKVAGANMSGLSAPSLALRSAWQTAYTAGFKLVDALRNMTALNSTGSFPALTMAMKDTIAQLLPMGKQTAATRAEMVSLAQEVNPNITNFQQLTKWLGNVQNPAQNLNKIAATLGINLQDLAKDASKLSSTMQTQLDNTFTSARLAATGVSGAVKKLGQDMGATHPNMKQMQDDAQILYNKLVNNHIMAPKVAADFVTGLDPAFRKTGTAAGDSGAAHDVNVFASSMGTAQKKADAFTHGSPYKAKVTVTGSGSGKITAKSTVFSPNNPFLTFARTGIRLPGYGGGDTVPAMLEPGETVVPKHLTRAVAPLMKAHNVPGFAAGGIAGGMAAVDKSFTSPPPWMASNETTFMADAAKAFMKAEIAAWKAASSGSGGAIANYAKSFLGRVPYVWGGVNVPGGADCSGFVETIYKHFGIYAPRTSEAQGAWVKRTAPTAGGLAFYNNPGGGPPPGHVAIIAADGSHVISQGGPLPGPTWTTLHGPGPLMWTGIPPHGFGLAGGAGGTQGQGQLESLWDQAGGAASLAHIMSAIAEAESGGNASARNPSGASGLWQILMPANARYVHGNVFNPLVNARAAVAIEKAQGLNAWSTYSSGAYQHFMNAGGLVPAKLMDAGGLVPPGPSVIYNGTGRPEHLVPAGGDNGDLVRELRLVNRNLATLQVIGSRAPAQTGYGLGRAMNQATQRVVGHGMHSVSRPVA